VTAAALLSIDRLGRRPLLLTGMSGVVLALFVLGLAYLLPAQTETSPENARRIAGATPAENLAMFVARWPPCMGTAPPGGAQGVWAYGAHNLLA
jgi:hypothetical protein